MKNVYKYSESTVRNIDENMKIIDLFSQNNYPFDLVVAELNGFHGSFINNKSTKYYQILNGSGIVTIDDLDNEVTEGDFIVIEKGQKHSLKGNMKFNIICTPPFNINDEVVL